MINIVFTICSMMAVLSIVGIAGTLFGIAIGKIKV